LSKASRNRVPLLAITAPALLNGANPPAAFAEIDVQPAVDSAKPPGPTQQGRTTEERKREEACQRTLADSW
jgi:hypothetical protein